jgi:hypothetical protein
MITNVGKTKSEKPPMTGNAWNPTYKHDDDWGMVDYCFHDDNLSM